MNAVAKADKQQVAGISQHPASDTTALIAMIERVALNPAIDIDKMERLLEMQERILARNAKTAYASAFSEMQGELPTIEERGHIVVREKAKDGSRTGDVIQDTPYALWEDINDGIKPVLARHGFALSFRPGVTADGRVSVTAILMHRDGHQEEATMILQHDSSGSKNAVQAIGSSTSYGKRYAAGALLNLTSRDGAERDDDGKGAVQTVSKQKAREVDAEMREEISACATVEQMEILWKSRPFRIEYERHPKDWQEAIKQHAAEHKKLLLSAVRPAVAPNFDMMEN